MPREWNEIPYSDKYFSRYFIAEFIEDWNQGTARKKI